MLIREGEQTSESEVSLDKETPVINHWLDNCQNDHADCASSESGFMLTRVVDVSDTENQKPSFVLKADLSQLNTTAYRYLALSRCWELIMPPTATTTSSKVAERLQAITTAGLSRIFTDFIDIARRMHVRFVWIDSLCIIQDFKEDWEKEAA